MRRLLATWTILAGGIAAADIVHLKDGGKLEGDLRRADSGWELRTRDGKTVSLGGDEVLRVELVSSPAAEASVSPEQAKAQLDAVRRMAALQSDPALVLQRYQSLLKQLGNSPVAAEARSDMELWQRRQSEGHRKIAGQWHTAQEVAQMQLEAASVVEKARDALAASQHEAARNLLDGALKIDPENVAANYLDGLLLIEQNQPVQARKAFERAVAAFPDHAPSLNNAAVTQWQQRAYVPAINNFEKAMRGMPLNATIHDNVAELIHAAPDDVARSAAYKRLVQRFEEDEPRLQSLMAASGWYRWGGTWVNAHQLDQLRQQELQIKQQLDELSREGGEARSRIEQIDAEIAANERNMHSLESNRYFHDAEGRLVRHRLPDLWYDLDRDNERLKSRRQLLVRHLESLDRQAEKVRAQVVLPPYTGRYRLLDVQFAPPTTRPAASQPAH